jgi:predicted MFS family arabinose efflux permease
MALRGNLQAGTLAWQQLAILLFGRLLINTAFRMVYPLLVFLAAGLQVDLRTAGLLVTLQVAATLLSPLGGTLADTYGDRAIILGGLISFCVGSLICALAASFWPFMAGYVLIGLATALYNPSVQAYASARTDYARRGRILGILELSWALSALVGVTLLTAMIEQSNAWAPAYWLLAGFGALTLLLSLFSLDPGSSAGGGGAAGRWQNVLRLPQVQSAMLLLFAMLAAVELIFVVYAGWLEADFGASTEQLGLVFGLFGVAELVGSAGSAWLVDRIGKRRSVLAAFAATGLTLLLLPFSAGNWWLFLPIFLLFGLFFEFAIVSAFPLVSGLASQARGTTLALAVAVIGLGRVVGSLIGPSLWQAYGFLANGLLAGTGILLAVLFGVFFLREGAG